MSFELDLDKPLGVSLWRVLGDQAGNAISGLENPQAPHEAIHEARKSCKRIRAALRLVRPLLGDALYREENARYRDAARLVSDVRDWTAMLETLDGFPADAPIEDRGHLRAALEERRDAALARVIDDGSLSHVAEAMRAGQRRMADWTLPHSGLAGEARALAAGVARVYRQGRELFTYGSEPASTPHLHDWRKRAKYLFYQLRLLRPVAPQMLRAQESIAHELADGLGDDHDYAVFAALTGDDLLFTPSEGAALRDHIEKRRVALRQPLWVLGARVYAESAKAFRRRLAAYFQAAPTAAGAAALQAAQ